MSGRLTLSAQSVADAVRAMPDGPREIGRLAAKEGLMLEVTGFRHAIGTKVRIDTGRAQGLFGEVVGFRGHRSLVLPFSADSALAAGARVEPLGAGDLVACDNSLLGRVIDAQGLPLDERPLKTGPADWPLGGRKTNPLRRGRVTRPLDVGVRAINGLLTVGEGQRVAIIAGSGVGKSVLMGQLIAGTDCDVLVVGLIGERSREVADFVETRLPGSVRGKSVVVAVPGDHPPMLRLRAAMRATAIAEAFRERGKRVLLLIDSLTRVAHAQREIGLTLGEPPTMKGYPPSVFSLIPALVERAGSDRMSGGSITAFYTVLADGGDIDDPVVDAARAIVDGHIVLSRSLSEQGVFPAIDVSRSLSRTMTDCVDDDHLAAAAQFRKLWSVHEENRDLMLMGAYSAGGDPVIDEAIARHPEQLDYLSQPAAATVDYAAARAALIKGYGS